LIAHFGHQYEEYRRRVPMLVPRLAVAAPAPPALRESEPVAQPVDAETCDV
jgi:hypothetical protein